MEGRCVSAATRGVRSRLQRGKLSVTDPSQDVVIAIETRITHSGDDCFRTWSEWMKRIRGKSNHARFASGAGSREIHERGAARAIGDHRGDESSRLIVLIVVPSAVVATVHDKHLLEAHSA